MTNDLKVVLNPDYFTMFLKHIYSYGIMDGLRILFDLPHEDTPLRWWGKTDEATALLLNALFIDSPNEHYYTNLRELYISFIQRGASIMYLYLLLLLLLFCREID